MSETIQTISKWHGGFCIEVAPLPCLIVIFGALGDLAGRKLLPSLYHLHQRGLLHEQSTLIACGRQEMSHEQYRNYIRTLDGMGKTDQLEQFLSKVFYHAGDYTLPETTARLATLVDDLENKMENQTSCRLFYLATAPAVYLPIVEQLANAGLTTELSAVTEKIVYPWRNVIFEKPFGNDFASAVELEQGLLRYLTEKQIYRIDHYLGKETVQNILMFRFANILFEPVWNRNYIDSVTITVSETVGVEHRAGYFEKAGLLRDMFQNHMLEMLSLVAMECPVSFSADRIRDEKVRLLHSIRMPDQKTLEQNLILGQYIAGNAMPGYREEAGVAHDSNTETFAALKLYIDNSRWQGIPFYLRSGKRMKQKKSEIIINFKHIPYSIFSPVKPEDLAQNRLILTVQPEEGLALDIIAKRPGPKLCMGDLTMNFKYSSILDPGENMPEAYERLLLDCMLGDQTLFIRSDSVRLAWQLLAPVLEYKKQITPFPYQAGTDGPIQAMEMIRRDGRTW